MPEEFPTCRHCNERIELINFAMGAEWRHWPSRYGIYNTNEKYRHCQTQVAEPMIDGNKPHSRACGIRPHEHGPWCSTDCPTCGGEPL